jgi:hypothetical protein
MDCDCFLFSLKLLDFYNFLKTFKLYKKENLNIPKYILSNTRDAKRICRLLRLFIANICYQCGNKEMLCLALKSRQMRRASRELFRELQEITLRL